MIGISNPMQAKALAVFFNSTAGRLQLMRSPAKTLQFPSYSTQAWRRIRIPDLTDEGVLARLVDCWERTQDMVAPQFRDGDCEVRRLWDETVASVIDLDVDLLARWRVLLCQEPYVRELGYGQYAD